MLLTDPLVVKLEASVNGTSTDIGDGTRYPEQIVHFPGGILKVGHKVLVFQRKFKQKRDKNVHIFNRQSQLLNFTNSVIFSCGQKII